MFKSSANFASNKIGEDQKEFLQYTVKEEKYCLNRWANGFRHKYMYVCIYVLGGFPFLLELNNF